MSQLRPLQLDRTITRGQCECNLKYGEDRSHLVDLGGKERSLSCVNAPRMCGVATDDRLCITTQYGYIFSALHLGPFGGTRAGSICVVAGRSKQHKQHTAPSFARLPVLCPLPLPLPLSLEAGTPESRVHGFWCCFIVPRCTWPAIFVITTGRLLVSYYHHSYHKISQYITTS